MPRSAAADGGGGSIGAFEIDGRLAGRELGQRRGAVGEGARHRGDDQVDVLAQRLEHLAGDQRRQEVPRPDVVHGHHAEDLDRAGLVAELKQEVADPPAALAVERILGQHLLVRGQRGGELSRPGQVAGLVFQISERNRVGGAGFHPA